MNILLIAGHGHGDPGAVSNGYIEADLAREVVSDLKEVLSDYAEVAVFDPLQSMAQYLRKANYNFKPYDYVLEIHFNALRYSASDGETKGTEIYVTTSEKSTAVETAIVNNISALGLKNRGVKRYNWFVISTAKAQGVSSALLEVCFIDDMDDMEIFLRKKAEIINAIAEGIAQGFKLTKKGETSMESFTDIKGHYAEQHIQKLKDYGIINGDGTGKFNPDTPITRADVAITSTSTNDAGKLKKTSES